MDFKEWAFIAVGVIIVAAIAGIIIGQNVGDGVTIKMVSKTEYLPGEAGQVIVELRDKQYDIVTANCTALILYPSKTTFLSGTMTSGPTGTKFINFTIPGVGGVYEYMANCTYGNKKAIDSSSFHVTKEDIDCQYVGDKTAAINEYTSSAWTCDGHEIYDICCNIQGNASIQDNGYKAVLEWFTDGNTYSKGESTEVDCELAFSITPTEVTCFQDRANVSLTNCSSNPVEYCFPFAGAYNQAGNVVDQNWKDGDWLTRTDTRNTELLVNYSVPFGMYHANWSVKIYAAGSTPVTGWTLTLSIPDECVNDGLIQTAVRTGSDHQHVPPQSEGFWWMHLQCLSQNGSWIWPPPTYISDSYHFGIYYTYETGMTFYMGLQETEEVAEFVNFNAGVRAWIEK